MLVPEDDDEFEYLAQKYPLIFADVEIEEAWSEYKSKQKLLHETPSTEHL